MNQPTSNKPVSGRDEKKEPDPGGARQEGEVGGNTKAHARAESGSRTAHKQPVTSGGRNVGRDT